MIGSDGQLGGNGEKWKASTQNICRTVLLDWFLLPNLSTKKPAAFKIHIQANIELVISLTVCWHSRVSWEPVWAASEATGWELWYFYLTFEGGWSSVALDIRPSPAGSRHSETLHKNFPFTKWSHGLNLCDCMIHTSSVYSTWRLRHVNIVLQCLEWKEQIQGIP